MTGWMTRSSVFFSGQNVEGHQSLLLHSNYHRFYNKTLNFKSKSQRAQNWFIDMPLYNIVQLLHLEEKPEIFQICTSLIVDFTMMIRSSSFFDTKQNLSNITEAISLNKAVHSSYIIINLQSIYLLNYPLLSIITHF